MTEIAVGPLTHQHGFDLHRRYVEPVAEIVDLREGLVRHYAYEAMTCMYLVKGAERQPRINLPAIDVYPGEVETWVLFADWDRGVHHRWPSDAEAIETARAFLSRPVLAHAGVYITRAGLRVIQELASPIPTKLVEPTYQHWLKGLEAAGIKYDSHAASVTNLFRMPNVVREDNQNKTAGRKGTKRKAGKPYASPGIFLDQMRPIELPRIAAPSTPASARRLLPHPKPDAGKINVVHVAELAPPWSFRVEPLADVVREQPDEWHAMFMALSGALLAKGLANEQLVAMVRAISAATRADTKDRESEARTTLTRHAQGLPCTGFARLREKWRDVALVLEDVALIQTQADLERWRARKKERERPLNETLAALRHLIRTAPPGVHLIKGDCGLGKSAELAAVAAERAQATHRSPDASEHRAPLHSVTVMSVDKHSLGRQFQDNMRARGVETSRLFGPLSVLDDEGKPVCQYHRTARALIRGGLSMQWELCDGRNQDPCQYRAECPARVGIEGPESARVWVAPHAMLAALVAKAGKTGLVATDEPPAPLEVLTFTVTDFEAAEAMLGNYFEVRYAAAMRPALEVFRTWFDTDNDSETLSAQEVARKHEAAVGEVTLRGARYATQHPGKDAAAFAAGAYDPHGIPRSGPPLRSVGRYLAKANPEFAERCGRAMRLVNTLHHVLTTERKNTARIDRERAGGRAMVLTYPNEPLMRAFEHQGTVLLLDANADVNRPIYTVLLGHEPQLHVFEAADGAPIERTHIQARGANRSGWLPKGQLVVSDGLVRAVTELFDWVGPGGLSASVGIVSMRILVLALQIARAPHARGLQRDWIAYGQSESILKDVVRRLGPIVARYQGQIRWGHYGAVRGLNHMKNVDCLVTLGDAWPNMSDVMNELAFCPPGTTWADRFQKKCECELEQAQGRLRTIHRTRPGRALHIGRVRPGGHAWRERVHARDLAGGPLTCAAFTQDVINTLIEKLGGVRAAAAKLHISPSALTRYRKGEREVSKGAALVMRDALGQLEDCALDPTLLELVA